jgi:hypothetical protein
MCNAVGFGYDGDVIFIRVSDAQNPSPSGEYLKEIDRDPLAYVES